MKTVFVVFDGPPSPEGPRFCEVDDKEGRSIEVGWNQRPDGFWILGPFYVKEDQPLVDKKESRWCLTCNRHHVIGEKK